MDVLNKGGGAGGWLAWALEQLKSKHTTSKMAIPNSPIAAGPVVLSHPGAELELAPQVAPIRVELTGFDCRSPVGTAVVDCQPL